MLKIFEKLMIGSMILMPSLALAAESGSHGVPYKVIFYQSLNISIALAVIIYFTREIIPAYFRDKHEEFHQLLTQAESKKRQAEAHHREIQSSLSNLKASQSENAGRAKAEAAELKARLLTDGQQLAKRLLEDAERLSRFEAERAKSELRIELLEDAVATANKSLADTNAKDLKKLDQQFVDKIEVHH